MESSHAGLELAIMERFDVLERKFGIGIMDIVSPHIHSNWASFQRSTDLLTAAAENLSAYASTRSEFDFASER